MADCGGGAGGSGMARRIFPMADWAPAQETLYAEPASIVSDRPGPGHEAAAARNHAEGSHNLANDVDSTAGAEHAKLGSRGPGLPVPWRHRPRSFLLQQGSESGHGGRSGPEDGDLARQLAGLGGQHNHKHTQSQQWRPQTRHDWGATKSGASSSKDAQPPSSLRSMFRRASVSLKGIVRGFEHQHGRDVTTGTHHGEGRRAPGASDFRAFLSPTAARRGPTSPNTRPGTAHSTASPWHRLRQAASFRHSGSQRVPYPFPPRASTSMYHGDRQGMTYGGAHSHYYDDDGDDRPLASSTFAPATVPIPGIGNEPPIIPHNTGAAAKAAVALQNEYLHGIASGSISLAATSSGSGRGGAVVAPSMGNAGCSSNSVDARRMSSHLQQPPLQVSGGATAGPSGVGSGVDTLAPTPEPDDVTSPANNDVTQEQVTHEHDVNVQQRAQQQQQQQHHLENDSQSEPSVQAAAGLGWLSAAAAADLETETGNNTDRESGIGIVVTSSLLELTSGAGRHSASSYSLSSDADDGESSNSIAPPRRHRHRGTTTRRRRHHHHHHHHHHLQQADTAISRIDFVALLPPELAIQILSYLDKAGLAVASRVSRRWRELADCRDIWRESFLREKTGTYAMGGPVRPGMGLGVPHVRPGTDWKEVYRVKEELDRRWREGRARPVYLMGHTDSVYCLQFDESKIITGSRDKTIRIWDMRTLECRLVIGPPEVINCSSILYDEEGMPVHRAVLGVASTTSAPANDDASHHHHQQQPIPPVPSTNPPPYSAHAPPPPPPPLPMAAQQQHEQQSRATQHPIRLSSSMPALVSFPTHHKASVLCLQYDARHLVTGSSDGTAIVYSVRSGYRPVRRLRQHTAAVLDLAFDHKHIVTCSKDATICVWDRETGTLLRQLRGHGGPVNAVQMRGNTLVSCSGDFRVKLWTVDTGRQVREFIGHSKGLACSQFSEDGRYVASAGNDRVIRIWDANTGECVREIRAAHDNLVRSLHVDSVSGRLVSGSYDTDVKVWDMATGRQLLDFPHWHSSWILSAKSDYRRIVSTGQDAKILVMDFGAGVRGIELLESVSSADAERSSAGKGPAGIASSEGGFI